MTVPAAVKVRIDAWTRAAKISEQKIFRPVNKGDRVTRKFIADEKEFGSCSSIMPEAPLR